MSGAYKYSPQHTQNTLGGPVDAEEIKPQPLIPVTREQIESGAYKLEPGQYVFIIDIFKVDIDDFAKLDFGPGVEGPVLAVRPPIDEAIRIFKLKE